MTPQLRIENGWATLGYEITKPRQEIHQQNAEMNMRQVHAQMFIQATSPRLLIDQTEAFADAGSKKIFRLIEEYAGKGRQAALEAIAKITQEGLTLRSVETGRAGAMLKQVNKQRYDKPYLPIQLDFIPRYGSLKIEGVPGDLQIDWQIGGVEMNTITHPATHHYQQGRIDFYLTQRNYVRLWIEPNVDMRL